MRKHGTSSGTRKLKSLVYLMAISLIALGIYVGFSKSREPTDQSAGLQRSAKSSVGAARRPIGRQNEPIVPLTGLRQVLGRPADFCDAMARMSLAFLELNQEQSTSISPAWVEFHSMLRLISELAASISMDESTWLRVDGLAAELISQVEPLLLQPRDEPFDASSLAVRVERLEQLATRVCR